MEHNISSCSHLTVDHDADNCSCCQQRRRRKQKKNNTGSLFSNRQYWDTRYENTTHETAGTGRNEWFVDFNMLKTILQAATTSEQSPMAHALEIGCGMSLLSEELLKHQLVSKVTAIDFSKPAIQHMVERQRTEVDVTELLHGTPVVYIEMDATNLSFDNNTFDFIVEKGTIDALLTDECGGDADKEGVQAAEVAEVAEVAEEVGPPQGNVQARALLSEAKRVLSDVGKLVVISHSASRAMLLQQCGFDVVRKQCLMNGNAEYHVFECVCK